MIGSLNILSNSMYPVAKFVVHQCVLLSTSTNILRDQAGKIILKYIQGEASQGPILKHDPEKVIECYFEANFTCGCNQDKGTGPFLVLSIAGFMLTYASYLIIWSSHQQTKNVLSTTKA